MNRQEISRIVVERLQSRFDELVDQFRHPGRVQSCLIDDLLPNELAHEIHGRFPEKGRMSFKNSIKERKYVSAQMNAHDRLMEEVVFAFQMPDVVAAISAITGARELEPDVDLYAGGISAMPKGSYLKPHLDNSHDGQGERYRALNLLYYVTPAWREEFGGNLELWDEGPRGAPRTITSRFNRLVIMATNRTSWHSVSTVLHDGIRCCVSNYYFSKVSPDEQDYFHATSFRGRPGEIGGDLVMRADNALRTAILKTTGNLFYKNPHVYKR